MINEEMREKIAELIEYVPAVTAQKAANFLGIDLRPSVDASKSSRCRKGLSLALEIDECDEFVECFNCFASACDSMDWDRFKFSMDRDIRVGGARPVRSRMATLGLAHEPEEADQLAVNHSIRSYRFKGESMVNHSIRSNTWEVSDEATFLNYISRICRTVMYALRIKIPAIKLVREEDQKSTIGYMKPDDPAIYLNLAARVYDVTVSEENALIIAGTIAHEVRHQWQFETHYLNLNFERDYNKAYEDRTIELDARLYELEFLSTLSHCPIISTYFIRRVPTGIVYL